MSTMMNDVVNKRVVVTPITLCKQNISWREKDSSYSNHQAWEMRPHRFINFVVIAMLLWCMYSYGKQMSRNAVLLVEMAYMKV